MRKYYLLILITVCLASCVRNDKMELLCNYEGWRVLDKSPGYVNRGVSQFRFTITNDSIVKSINTYEYYNTAYKIGEIIKHCGYTKVEYQCGTCGTVEIMEK